MKAFGGYVRSLEQLYLSASQPGVRPELIQRMEAALDGEAGRELRRLIPLEELRATGTFFTGSRLAAKVAERVLPTVGPRAKILDPACGAGDLLLACAHRLPSGRGFLDTLNRWGRSLLGRDIQQEFVAAARLRLGLAALRRGFKPRASLSEDYLFSGIKTGCGRTDSEAVGRATHIVMNPPFNLVLAPAGCDWTSGEVSAAALFMDECLRLVTPGTRVVAILPDVLRSGERYRRWRERICQQAMVESIELIGQFDRWADIDVFIIDLLVTSESKGGGNPWAYPVSSEEGTVGDRFDVSVGPLVPFRHGGEGPKRPYIHARGVPAWGEIEKVTERCRFAGKLHAPPFTVIRRTSRLGDKHRAVATVVCGGLPVAVENHLLVLKPKDGRTETCRELLAVLRSPETDGWLNQRIRCRHLTVSAIRDLPLLSVIR